MSMAEQKHDVVSISAGKGEFSSQAESFVVPVRINELAQSGFCGSSRERFGGDSPSRAASNRATAGNPGGYQGRRPCLVGLVTAQLFAAASSTGRPVPVARVQVLPIIIHDNPYCMVKERFPVLQAVIESADRIETARIYFRSELKRFCAVQMCIFLLTGEFLSWECSTKEQIFR